MKKKALICVPVYNEKSRLCLAIESIVNQCKSYNLELLCLDDGSEDGSWNILEDLCKQFGFQLLRNTVNQGYGACVKTFFRYAWENGYDFVITVDADGQHLPQDISRFLEAIEEADIVSGSRYMDQRFIITTPPADRERINMHFVRLLRRDFGYNVTDAFCGFRAYRVKKVCSLRLEVDGYGFPIELWVEAAYNGLRYKEIPILNIYNDYARCFGGGLDDEDKRFKYYLSIYQRTRARYRYSCGCRSSG